MSDYVEFETPEEKRAFKIGYAKGRNDVPPENSTSHN